MTQILSRRRKAIGFLASVCFCLTIAGCSKPSGAESAGSLTVPTVPSDMDFSYTDRDRDASFSAEGATRIALRDDGSIVEGKGATVSGNIVTLTAEGTYILSGTLSNGQILVDAGELDKLQIVLNEVSLTCESHAPLFIKSADKVFLTLAEGTNNVLTDGGGDSLSQEDANVDGTLFSRADLTLNGTGSLTITARYRHGIVSKDDLVITGGQYTISASGDGIQGKDCVKILDGTFTLDAGGDGIQSSNAEDASRGFVSIDGGTFSITAGNDGIQAQTVLRIASATIQLYTGGGSANASTDSQGNSRPDWGTWGPGGRQPMADTAASTQGSTSAKGLKAGSTMTIDSGTFTIDSSDDAVHVNGDLVIRGGTFTLSSGDDGIHADATILISGGMIDILKSYEGLEGLTVQLTGGHLNIISSDDGINGAGGNDGSSLNGRPGQNSFAVGTAVVRISGGSVVVDARGDGIDANGSVYIEGGAVLVNGPTDSGNGALDYDGTAQISGGTVLLAGSAGMVQTFTSDSTQNSVLYTFSPSLSGGTRVTLTDADGAVLVSCVPTKAFQSVVISTPALQLKKTYQLCLGGELEGANADGLTEGGTLTGTQSTVDLTLSSVSTIFPGGATGGMGGNPPGGMGGGRR